MISRPRRWSPTPEQLMVLQELYRKGLRNPNSSQVRTITDHLALYGKVEGKNVFYWFQNHKARDRQKLRKALLKQMHHQHRQFILPAASGSCNLSQSSTSGGSCLSNDQRDPSDNARWLFSNPTTVIRQGGDENAPLDRGNCAMMRTSYERDWMLMMGMVPSFPCCVNRTPKTLELFPLKSNNNIKDNQNSCS